MVVDVVTGRRLSTVTTASVTGDTVHELSGVDLAMRLHYLRILYYFRPGGAVGDGLTTPALKEPMFPMLDRFSPVAGRIRKGEAGRPHVKCNDSGVRIVEASCERRMDEWLEAKGADWADGQLVPDNVLGPDLYFSPLLFVQFTRFKCGGLAVGVSWPHVLGDAVSASDCINLWGRLLAGKPAPQEPHYSPNPKNSTVSPASTGDPLSLKQVETNGDLWLPHTKHRMVTSSFRITRNNLQHLQSKISRDDIAAFESISALIWQSIARFREEKETNMVTKIHNDCSEERKDILTNKQIISTVAADSSPAKLEVSELAMLISEASKDEKQAIEEMVQRENGVGDYIVYGANLTFIDMEGVDLYGFDLKGQKPVCLEYNISGVGDEGAVLVLPEPDDARDGRDNDGGKTVIVILPEHEMPKLKEVLGREWGIA